MVAPVTGPTVKVTQEGNGRDYYKNQTIYRQRPPFNLVLDYKLKEAWATSGQGNYSVHFVASEFDVTGGGDGTNAALASCREKFSGKIADSAGIGVDLAEYSQSVDMLGNALTKVSNIALDIRRRDFGKLMRDIDPRGIHRDVSWSKSFANNFLQVHFGWEPLMADIHDATQVISNPIKNTFVRSSAFDQWQHDHRYSNGDYGFYLESQVTSVTVKMGADVAVTNPNLHLADQLGLLNPLSLAWELVPYSFVVDWFANVGQFIGQVTDFAGLALSRAYTSYFFRSNQSLVQLYTFSGYPAPYQTATGMGVQLVREVGIASVPLIVRPLKLPSVTRAITAWALLMQKL